MSERIRLMLVDDHPLVRDGLKARMDSVEDIEVVGEAGDAHAALAEIERCHPGVILMDIGMPKLNGYDTCRRIRSKPWGKAITLIALTGWGQDEDKRHSREAGFDGHLVKPVEPADLEKHLVGLRMAAT